MADALATQDPEEGVSATAPATPNPEIETLKAAYEDRFKGMQRLVSERDRTLADLQRKMEDLEIDRLPEDDRAKAMGRRQQEEVAALRAENELLKLRTEFPNEVPAFEKLLRATTPKEQLEVLRELAQAQVAKPSVEKPEPPETDPNNPMRQYTSAPTVDGQEMTDELADRILNAAPKGSLFRLRR